MRVEDISIFVSALLVGLDSLRESVQQSHDVCLVSGRVAGHLPVEVDLVIELRLRAIAQVFLEQQASQRETLLAGSFFQASVLHLFKYLLQFVENLLAGDAEEARDLLVEAPGVVGEGAAASALGHGHQEVVVSFLGGLG